MAIRRIFGLLAALTLAACATPNPLASPEDDADGKRLTAKPGLSRIYVIHGDRYSREPQDADIGWAVLSGGLLAGMVMAVSNEVRKDEPPEPPKPIPMPGTYYLDGQLLGAMEKGHYMAIDVPPGEYEFAFKYGVNDGPSQRVKIDADGIAYLKSIVRWQGGDIKALLSSCDEDCPVRIAAGRRVAVEWPPKAIPSK
jgi:hypothetical protein